MLEGAFSLGGRIGRLRFFLDSLALAAGCVVLAILLVVLAAPVRHAALGFAFFGLCAVLVAAPVLWVSLSLYARRWRDIGLDPLYLIPGWIVLEIADALVAARVPAWSLAEHGGTALGALVNAGLTLALFFWPGREGADAAPPTISRATRLASLGLAAPEAPRPAGGRPAARRGFGRRRIV